MPSTSSKNLNFLIQLGLKTLAVGLVFLPFFTFISCQPVTDLGPWDYKIDFKDRQVEGVLRLDQKNRANSGSLISFNWGTLDFEKLRITNNQLSANFQLFDKEAALNGTFDEAQINGTLQIGEETYLLTYRKPILRWILKAH